MDSQEIERRQDSAMLLRTEMCSKKRRLKDAIAKHREVSGVIVTIGEDLKYANLRLSELTSGKGKALASVPDIDVYEFWLSIPGYQGSIQGAKAELAMHGSLQHVSNVSSTSKSGLSGGIVGGLIFGPLGAAAGVLATRKNKVSTRIQEVDTRQVELQITGPGYAWSVVAHSGYVDKFREIRDLINAQGSNRKTIKELCREQGQAVSNLQEKLSRLEKDLEIIGNEAEKRKLDYGTVKKNYASTKLPLVMDLKFRWECLPSIWRWAAIIFGPALLIILASMVVYASITVQPWVNQIIGSALGYVLLWFGVIITYLIRYRI
ncbi:hypothetical protein HX798_01110 [Pseudomonas putida]|uniref:Uncharacterized protein n=1 Tax=Pseudomonas putida TaxID=303 RepID=A0A7Y7Z6X4_PSEPU|nr:hypothetical protein [Pseudomonas putida]NWC78882.1 hypothetical protein [Pseudomonas putida]